MGSLPQLETPRCQYGANVEGSPGRADGEESQVRPRDGKDCVAQSNTNMETFAGQSIHYM